jgi:hypothetical protein
MNGYLINKAEEAQNYGVNEQSIQRDIDDIRNYLDNDAMNAGLINSVVDDRIAKGYGLEQIYKMKLSNSEVLAICKILLDSRAFTKIEMQEILDKLVSCCLPKSNQKLVTELISNEEFHYVEPRHKTVFIDTMWDIGQAIRDVDTLK